MSVLPLCLDGRALAHQVEVSLSARVASMKVTPALAILLIGEDSASQTYVRMKLRACERVGIRSHFFPLPAGSTTEEVCELIRKLNEDPSIHGIMMEHPAPKEIQERICFDTIQPEKDVDGANAVSFGRIAMGDPAFGSATPAGIMRLMRHHNISLAGIHAVVIGRSAILGRPMAAMLINAHATVTICHSHTRDLPAILRQADLVVAALHRERYVQADWIKEGAVVIDAGYHPSGSGDVDMLHVAPKTSAYTPVPGGVGPMTVSTILAHTVTAAEGTYRVE